MKWGTKVKILDVMFNDRHFKDVVGFRETQDGYLIISFFDKLNQRITNDIIKIDKNDKYYVAWEEVDVDV